MVSEGAAVLLTPRRMLASPVLCVVVPVEWREWCVVVLSSRLCVALSSLCCLALPCIILASLLSVCCRVCCGWGSAVGGVVSSFVFLFSLSPSSPLCWLVFGVVRAQPCEHARYPRTPLRLSCCLLLFFAVLPAFLHTSPFFCCCGMAVGDSPCVGVLCWHDGYG